MIPIKNINTNKKEVPAVLKVKLFFYTVIFFAVLSIFTTSDITPKVKAAELGENTAFLIDSSYDSKDRSEAQAYLKKINSSAYFYVESEYYDGLPNDLKKEFDASLSSLADDFESTIYPRMKQIFGSEWNPGIDNDGRITIFFTRTKENIGGYFNPNDEYKKSDVVSGKSNEREMIYLNAVFINNHRIKSFLAHEFQHMITWYYKNKLRNISDDIWLNEARSEYASTAIGYDDEYPISNLRARVESFETNPVDSLTEWQNKLYDYSSVNLFSQYLVERFGKDIFKRMLDNNKVGIESISKALSDLYYKNDTFESVFTDWTVANYVNGTSSDDKYKYQNLNLSYNNFHILPKNNYELSANLTENVSESIKDWSGEYYEFAITNQNYAPSDRIKINFNGQNSGSFSVPVVISYDDKTKEVNELRLNSEQDSAFYIYDAKKKISAITVIPISHQKTSGFGNNIGEYSFSFSIKFVKGETYKDGSLLKSTGSDKVYTIENGQKRWITTAETFVSSGYQWKNIVIVMDFELNIFPNGENIANSSLKPNGSLLKGSGNEVYLIENGKKRWITTAEVFASKGYKWEDVIIVENFELSLYPEGENIR